MYAGRRNIGILSGAAMMILAAGGYQPAHAQVSEGQAVARAGEALIKAMIDIDRGQLEALASDNLSYGHSAGRIENKQQFIDYLVSKASAFRTINLSDQTVSVLGNDAIVRHLFTGETVNPSGQVTPVRIGVLQVWQKESSNWRLLARQAYRL